MEKSDGRRGPRMTTSIVAVLPVLMERSTKGQWTTVRELSELLPALTRTQINNAVRSAVAQEIAERTPIEPYAYRIKPDLDGEADDFVVRALAVGGDERPATSSNVIHMNAGPVIAERHHVGDQTDRWPTRIEIPYGPRHFRSVPFTMGSSGRTVGGSNVLKLEIIRWLDDSANLDGGWTFERDFTEGAILFDDEADAAKFMMRWMGEGN